MPKKSKTPSKAKPVKLVKKPIKSNGLSTPKSNGKARSPIDESKLSAPMQAGLAAVAVMEPTNDKPIKETKLTHVIALLSRPNGATIDEITDATGWQKHTARAAISHALGKKRGYQIVSEKPKGGKRSYKIVETLAIK